MGVHDVELNEIDVTAGLTLNTHVAALRRKVPFQFKFVGWTLTSAPPSRVSFE
jgi:hypothetical protein